MIGIIIPVCRGEQLLGQTIAGIRRTITSPYRIYIVSDFISPVQGDDIVSVIGDYRLGEAKNAGANAALRDGAQYLYFIDAHMEFPDRGWDRVLISFLGSHERSVISPKVYVAGNPGQTVFSFVWFPPDFTYRARPYPGNTMEVPSLCGCSQFMSRKAFEDSGFGYTPFFGIDDYEFSLRMWRFGYNIYSIGEARIGHEENRARRGSVVTGTDANERSASYLMFTRLHYPQIHMDASMEAERMIAPYMPEYKCVIEENSLRSVGDFHERWRHW